LPFNAVDLLGSLASHVGSLTLPRAQLSDLCRCQQSHHSSSAASSPSLLIERLVTELADRADAAAAAQADAAAAALHDVRLPPHVRLRRQ
jgi:hypothetical protein